MECTHNGWLNNEEYLKQFRYKVAKQRIPISGSFELTRRCNLRCVHCYLFNKKELDNDQKKRELTTQQWIRIIDQIVSEGCLSLLITGGDPLLRNDFKRIYLHAKKKGLLVTVFTNGTLITKDILELFREWPPQTVDITLYGATENTYAKITGVKGFFKQCLTNIDQLNNHGIDFQLKTILMSLNRHEFYDIERIAKRYNVKFRFDAEIFPRFNGDNSPVNLRVDPKEVVKIEISDKKRKEDWIKFYNRMSDIPVSDYLYKCGTGLTTFHVTAYGELQPCLMAIRPQYNLLAGSFSAGWRNVIPSIRKKEVTKEHICSHCESISLCRYCPPMFELETGKEGIGAQFSCNLGQYRYRTMKKIVETRRKYDRAKTES